MAVDPLYYLVQLILFPISVLIFGVFLHHLWIEVTTDGFELSARFVWRVCLCVSSLSFCILQLDPSSVLNILTSPWRNFVGYSIVSLVLNSACCTFYMYIIVLSIRYLPTSKVPPLFTHLWIAANVLTTLANCLVGMVGAITDNAFWFGICNIILAIQELIIVGVVNATLHKMGRLLFELEATQTNTSYAVQRRKLWVIRIATTLLVIINLVNVMTSDTSDIHALEDPRPSKHFNPEVFDVTYPIDDVLISLAHLLLLYASHRPASSRSPSSNVVRLSERSIGSV